MHFHVRDTATGGVRAMDKYLERIDDIRRIQTFLIECAEREGVEVVENANVEQAIESVIALTMGLGDPVGRPA
jgi:2-phosphoglycerate kinase